MIDQLQAQIKEVARLRELANVSDLQVKALKAQWEDVNSAVIGLAKNHAEQVKMAEDALRKLTLEVYEQTKNKAPAPGVGIRIMTELEYNPTQAFDWAKTHGLAIKLDTPAFEKIAKASPMDFVKVVEKPTATIASKLE